jgi:hypothetical protein
MRSPVNNEIGNSHSGRVGESELIGGGLSAIYDDRVGLIGQSFGFITRPASGKKGEAQDEQVYQIQVYPIKVTVFWAAGGGLGVCGIMLGCLGGARWGDCWGYFGIVLMVVGFYLCWLAGGFVNHASASLNRRSENVRIEAIINVLSLLARTAHRAQPVDPPPHARSGAHPARWPRARWPRCRAATSRRSRHRPPAKLQS